VRAHTHAAQAKLLDKEKEVQQLRTKIQQLEAQGIKVCGGAPRCTGAGKKWGRAHMRPGRRLAAAACFIFCRQASRCMTWNGIIPYDGPWHAHSAAALRRPQARLAATSMPAKPSGPGGAYGGGGGASSATPTLPAVSAEEAAALRKEMDEQEALIRGYQQENVAAMRRIKVGGVGRGGGQGGGGGWEMGGGRVCGDWQRAPLICHLQARPAGADETTPSTCRT
jgi:hypothetical protein